MAPTYTTTARRLGVAAASATVVLLIAYTVTLLIGFATLDAPDAPIGDPMFTMLEVLILALLPALVGTMVALHAWAPDDAKTLTLTAVVFMALVAGVTGCVHFTVLTLSRQPAFADPVWQTLIFSFTWPSVVYALDILSWDVFFPLAMLFGAAAVRGQGLEAGLRWLMIAAGLLALAGLSGVVTGDMRLRNIGIVGYVGVFLVVAVLLAVLFARTPADDAPAPGCPA